VRPLQESKPEEGKRAKTTTILPLGVSKERETEKERGNSLAEGGDGREK